MHLLVVVAVLMVSCGSTAVEDSAPPDAGTETPTAVPAEPTATSLPEPTATAVPTAAPEPVDGEELRAERVEQVVDVVLAVLNGERAMSEADYDTFFADGFRAQVPYATFQGINAQLAPSAPWSVVEPLVQGRDRGQMLVENAAGDRVTVGVAIVEGEVTELLLQPWTEPVTDVAEAFELLEGIGEFAYLIAEVTDADGRPAEPTPILFKNYTGNGIAFSVHYSCIFDAIVGKCSTCISHYMYCKTCAYVVNHKTAAYLYT